MPDRVIIRYNNEMKPSILAIRSVGAELANRIFVPITIVVMTILGGLMSVGIWLTTLNDWWWLLVIFLIVVASVAIIVLTMVRLVIKSVTPPQSRYQKKQTKVFVTKLQQLAETAQTPKFILLFRVVRDIASPRDNGIIGSISNSTSSLKHNFTALVETFR